MPAIQPLCQGISRTLIAVQRDSRRSLVVTAAHIAVHGKINLACLAHIQNLDSVGIIIDPRIILALAERKYLCALFFSCIINPERPVCHKGTVFPRLLL